MIPTIIISSIINIIIIITTTVIIDILRARRGVGRVKAWRPRRGEGRVPILATIAIPIASMAVT